LQAEEMATTSDQAEKNRLLKNILLEKEAHLLVPTLVMNGGASYSFMSETARGLSKAMPHAQHCILEGQGHGPADEVLVPVLVEFFKG
jgi:pimeloyl-ACP methyl ester carboxylesterase